MSGPLSTADAPATTGRDVPAVCEMEVLEGRAAEVGGFGVRRVLPRREHRTVGAWCFVDHMGPATSVMAAAWTSDRTPYRAADGHVSARGGGPSP